MQAFIDRQLAFDTYLPGTPHETGDLSDLFPYHIWGRGNIPQSASKGQKEKELLRQQEAIRRRRAPSCVEEACAYGNLPYLILLYAQEKFQVLTRRGVYEGSDASPLMWAAFKGHMHIVKFLVSAALTECQKLTLTPSEEGATKDTERNPAGGGLFGLYGSGSGNNNNSNGGGGGNPAASATTTVSPLALYNHQQEAFNQFINFQSTLGHTALQWAIISGNVPIVRFLLDHNANPFHRDRQGFDAAFAAVQNDQLAILLMLLEDSIAARAITLVRGSTADTQEHAVTGIREEGKAGAPGSDDADDDDGMSGAFHYVVDVEKITKVLNDPHRPPPSPLPAPNGSNNLTPVQDAGQFIRRTNYYFLDPSMRDVEGHNLLHWAAYRNSPATCQYLVHRWHCDVNVQDVHGRTPLIWAAREGFSEVIEFFCLHGANRNLSDKDGFTAAQYALVRNHPEAHHVLTHAPDVNLQRAEETGLLTDTRALAKLKSYATVRTRRAYGTLRMALTYPLFACQMLFGLVYMMTSFLAMAMVPSVFSYFPYGIYFFKNMLWTAFVRHPTQSSKSNKRDVGKEAGLPTTLAESVRGTWLYRLREPANMFCILTMMCLQMYAWGQLGLTPFIHSVFSFSFLFRPFSVLAPSAVSLADSGIVFRSGSGAANDDDLVNGTRCTEALAQGEPEKVAMCQTHLLERFLATHDTHYRTQAMGQVPVSPEAAVQEPIRSGGIQGSGYNIMSEVKSVEALLTMPYVATAAASDSLAPPSYKSPEQLFDSSNYFGAVGPLGWLFGGDAVRMVSIVLPLLFTLTIFFFVLTKLTANRSVMKFTTLTDRFRRGGGASLLRGAKQHKGQESPYTHEGNLANSPVWRVLRSRQYHWLHPRSLLLERHTQIPIRAFYCPEQDTIVRGYDGYSILLDCPIGASNHRYFILGLTCFVLFECSLFFWGVHQLKFFTGLLSPTDCQYEHWTSGLTAGLRSAEGAKEALQFLWSRNTTTTVSTQSNDRYCYPSSSHLMGFSWAWLNHLLNLLLHGIPRKQNFYFNLTLIPRFVERATSLASRLEFIFLYYWWPTRVNLYSVFVVHFSLYAMIMGIPMLLRQWSGVWRGATRMELSNPITACQTYGGRFIATFPLSAVFEPPTASARLLNGGQDFTFETADYDAYTSSITTQASGNGGGSGNGFDGMRARSGRLAGHRSGSTVEAAGGAGDASGSSPHAQLCNIELSEEAYYERTDPAKARVVRANGIGLRVKSIYANSQWAIVNVLAFLAGRAGARWNGAMSVSASLQPVKAPMVSEYL